MQNLSNIVIMNTSPYEESLREVVWFSLERRMLWGNPIAAFQYIKRAYKREGERLFYEGL